MPNLKEKLEQIAENTRLGDKNKPFDGQEQKIYDRIIEGITKTAEKGNTRCLIGHKGNLPQNIRYRLEQEGLYICCPKAQPPESKISILIIWGEKIKNVMS
jgi:hypothetical protein